MYGPAFRPRIPAEAISTRSKDAYPADVHDGPPTWRRSVYAFVKRSVPNPLAEVFDAPGLDCRVRPAEHHGRADPESGAPERRFRARLRHRSGPARWLSEAGPELTDRVGRAYELALGRPPARRRAGRCRRVPLSRRRSGRSGRPLPRAVHAQRVSLHRLTLDAGGLGWTHIGPIAAADG